MSVESLRSQFPSNLRKLWEIDRILIEEPRSAGAGSRYAIDLRAGYAPAQRGMGSGTSRLSRKVPVADALLAMAPHLEGASIERVDVWGADLNNAALDAVLATDWFREVKVLNLGANRLTSKAVASLSKHSVAGQLEDLTLSYNKLGNALAKAAFPALTSLELVYCGLDDKALVNLGKAPMPKLRRLMLEGAATYIALGKLSKALHDGMPEPRAEYSAETLVAFGESALGKQLEMLGLGSLSLGEAQARAVAAGFSALKTLDLTAAKMSAASVKALGEGGGLKALERLALERSFAPNYGARPVLQAPSQETAEALASLASSSFAETLEELVLNQIAVGPDGLRALCAGSLKALRRLEVRNCQLGHAGALALAASQLPLRELLLDGNALSADSVRALAEGAFAGQLEMLGLTTNPVGDRGVEALKAFKGLKKLSLTRCEVTDAGALALSQGSSLQGLAALFLVDNLIADAGAQALAKAAGDGLERLALQRNCLSPAGVASVQRALGDRASLAGQDPSKLPPALVDNPSVVFAAVPPRSQPVHDAPVDGLRRHLPEAQLDRDEAYPNWLFAFPTDEEGDYLVHAYDVARDLLVSPKPPIVNGLPCVVPSPDGEWLAVKAFCDGIYAVRVADGTSTRIADTLDHQKGGVVFCDGRIVALDADTEADEWQGRLQVFGQKDGKWVLEHSVGGFFKVFDDIVPLANHRMFAVLGRAGMFFCAVRGSELRYLGRLNKNYPVFDHEGQPTLNPTPRTSCALKNVDEVLDAAFASGSSVTSIDLPKAAWG